MHNALVHRNKSKPLQQPHGGTPEEPSLNSRNHVQAIQSLGQDNRSNQTPAQCLPNIKDNTDVYDQIASNKDEHGKVAHHDPHSPSVRANLKPPENWTNRLRSSPPGTNIYLTAQTSCTPRRPAKTCWGPTSGYNIGTEKSSA